MDSGNTEKITNGHKRVTARKESNLYKNVTAGYTEQDDVKSRTPGGILVTCFRYLKTIVTNDSATAFGNLVTDYINNPKLGTPTNPRDRLSTRGNITKELERASITWKVFNKFLMILKCTHYDFTIRIHSPFYESQTYSRTVYLTSDAPVNNAEPVPRTAGDPNDLDEAVSEIHRHLAGVSSNTPRTFTMPKSMTINKETSPKTAEVISNIEHAHTTMLQTLGEEGHEND